MKSVGLVACLALPGWGDEGARREGRAKIGLYWLSSFSVSSMGEQVVVPPFSWLSSEWISVEFSVGAIAAARGLEVESGVVVAVKLRLQNRLVSCVIKSEPLPSRK